MLPLPTLSPKAIGVGLGAIALLCLVASYEVRLRRANGQVAQLRGDLAAVQVELAQTQANRDELKVSLEEQNKAVRALQERGRQLEDAATARAVRTLRDGEVARRQIVNSTDSGPERMNAWMLESLSP